MSELGALVLFSQADFLKAARCMQLNEAIAYVERYQGPKEVLAMRDAFQLSYVAASLLDAGRASVTVHDEKHRRKSIERAPWAADGCAGRCRSIGRLYRLSADDPYFFLRVTDTTINH